MARKLLAAIALAVAMWGGATAAASATVPDVAPVGCEDLIDQPLQAELASSGYRAAETMQMSDEPTMHDDDAQWSAWSYIFEEQGLTCWWLREQDPDAVAVGYAVVDDRDALEADLAQNGYSRTESPDGPVYTLIAGPDSTVVLSFPAREVLLPENDEGAGVVMAARGLTSSALAVIRARILPLLDLPDPVVIEAEADGADETVTDETASDAVGADASVPAAASTRLDDSAAAPSTLSGLRTPGEVDLSPVILGCTLALTLVFAAILAFPGKLMETAISENYDRVSRLWAPLAGVARRIGAPLARAGRAASGRLPRSAPLAIGVIAAAIIAGFVDPSFGWNAGSVRMVASNLVSFGVEAILGAALVAALARRWAIAPTARIGLVAGSIGILLVSVLLSRLTGFVPGVVFGLIIAATLPSALSRRDGLRLAVAEVAYIVGAGMAAWFLYGILADPLTTSGGILDRFAIESLAAITVLGLSALPIVLLPIRGMAGEAIFAAGRGMWMIVYAIGASLFMLVLLPFPGSWEQTSAPFWVWIVLFAIYAGVSVTVWYVLTKTRGGAGAEAMSGAGADRAGAAR
ncbi:hypothetical protein AB2L57_04070 [Microbacterium sp. HA-8]|uniref:hypothetical protein n=1 Tax=Microbacterium sp. HA-8 TaxID=3234200 RepID=UPI0038F635CC